MLKYRVANVGFLYQNKVNFFFYSIFLLFPGLMGFFFLFSGLARAIDHDERILAYMSYSKRRTNVTTSAKQTTFRGKFRHLFFARSTGHPLERIIWRAIQKVGCFSEAHQEKLSGKMLFLLAVCFCEAELVTINWAENLYHVSLSILVFWFVKNNWIVFHVSHVGFNHVKCLKKTTPFKLELPKDIHQIGNTIPRGVLP